MGIIYVGSKSFVGEYKKVRFMIRIPLDIFPNPPYPPLGKGRIRRVEERGKGK